MQKGGGNTHPLVLGEMRWHLIKIQVEMGWRVNIEFLHIVRKRKRTENLKCVGRAIIIVWIHGHGRRRQSLGAGGRSQHVQSTKYSPVDEKPAALLLGDGAYGGTTILLLLHLLCDWPNPRCIDGFSGYRLSPSSHSDSWG